MLGTAARISTAVPIGRLSHGGDSWVRNTAMPRLIGTPSTNAMSAVESVPAIAGQAP
jgi:hypothetical protein